MLTYMLLNYLNAFEPSEILTQLKCLWRRS